MLASKPSAISFRARDFHILSIPKRGRPSRRCSNICAAYNVDVEKERQTPNSPPSWGSSPPPPPPPPPPPMPPTGNRFNIGNFKLPNGRDFMIGMLGAGIGVAGMWLFYETSIPDFTDEDFEAIVAEEAINRILENDTDFLNALDAAIQLTFPDDLINGMQQQDAPATP